MHAENGSQVDQQPEMDTQPRQQDRRKQTEKGPSWEHLPRYLGVFQARYIWTFRRSQPVLVLGMHAGRVLGMHAGTGAYVGQEHMVEECMVEWMMLGESMHEEKECLAVRKMQGTSSGIRLQESEASLKRSKKRRQKGDRFFPRMQIHRNLLELMDLVKKKLSREKE